MSAESPPPNRMQGREPITVQLDPKWYARLVQRLPGQ